MYGCISAEKLSTIVHFHYTFIKPIMTRGEEKRENYLGNKLCIISKSCWPANWPLESLLHQLKSPVNTAM